MSENRVLREQHAMINNSSGFTLVEFVVATFILMIGMLGMLQGINLAMEKSVATSLRNEAVALVDERMMTKRSKAFVNISTSGASAPTVSVSRYFRGLFKNYSVQEIVNLTTPNSKEIILNVSWKYKNKRSTHSVSSIVSSTPQ